MSTTAVYQYVYEFYEDLGGTVTVFEITDVDPPFTLTEIDGDMDGFTDVPDFIGVESSGESPQSFALEFLGIGPVGEPIMQGGATDDMGRTQKILFSDTDYNDGDEVSTFLDRYEFCFAPGTGIATPEGERPVEALKIGDPILTADGSTVPVKWIGRQTMHKMFTPADRYTPVRVSAGALAENVPHTDLVLTGSHALVIDGMAINASALVNHTSITFERREDMPETVTYYHVETEAHDVILANGAAAETFIDYASRQYFDNYAEYVSMFGEQEVIQEMPLPRIATARLLPPSVSQRLGMRKAG